MVLLVAGIVGIFAVIICFALFVQPRQEEQTRTGSTDEAWAAAGFESLRSNGFMLCQIAPTPCITVAEFVFLDECGQEFGRFTSALKRSANIACGGRSMHLYIQGSGINRTMYSGKVGGTANDSIVIRDDNGVIAEIWRRGAWPPITYEVAYGGEKFDVRTGGWRPSSPGTIHHNSEQVGAFRRPSVFRRNILIAFEKNLPAELRTIFCSTVLLQ